jgi:Txe/YoeB family toxin of Txe-Axe toxin-antitoxin module
MRIIKKSKVVFVNDKIEKEFNNLRDNDETKKWIKNAIENLKQNAFCGIPLPKRLIPREYVVKYSVNNLWKYDLPTGWRLIYTIKTPNRIEILSVILEWFNHPDYERKFRY